MKKSLIVGLSRIVDSQVTDSNKRLDEYVLGSLRKNGLESLANIEEHEDGIRVSLQGYPFAYVDVYLDGEKVVADYSRNAQEVYPGTVKKYAQFAGIPEEQAKTEVEKFYKWMHVIKEHSGGLVDDIQKLKVSDSEDETEEVKDFRVYVKKSVKDKIQKALAESEYEFEDCGATTSSDVDAEIPEKTKPVDDSRQDEVISYSWDEFEQKLNDYKELNAHSVVIGDKTYILSGTVVEDKVEDKVGDSADYRIEDDREYSKQQLIDRPPLWIKDKDIWEKAVDKATRGGSKDTIVIVPLVIYKRMGGTKALNKKEKEERAKADERRMQAETSREGVEDSMYEKIKVGDTLRIVRGDHVGKFAEVLEVKEDGSYRLKDLQTNEEFEEPVNLFGVRVTVTDSGYSDSEDGVSLRSALATILKETDPKVRKRSIQSKVLSFLNAYGMDAEIESDGKIWLNDDDTSVRVDESTVSIKKGGEFKTEDYALLEDIEKWYGRIKELSGK